MLGRFVRTSRCYIFNLAWDKPTRLMLKPATEGTFRDSLENFLVANLRDVDVDVRPEQNIGDGTLTPSMCMSRSSLVTDLPSSK